MTWFVIALIGYLFLAVVFVLDKLILTKSVQKPTVYTFYSTIFMLGAVAILPFGGGLLHGWDWWWAIVSGVAFGFGMWTMYVALKYGETSHISPFVGGVVTIATYGISAIFLAERLNGIEIVGMVVLVLSSFILAYKRNKKIGKLLHVGLLWAILSGILFAISHVSAKYIYDLYPFITGFAWTRATTGLVGLFLLCFPSVRHSFHKKKHTESVHRFAKRHAVSIVISDKILSILGVVLVQYAIAIGTVTMVNAMSGIQYILMFIIIYVLTKFAPKIFREYFTHRELIIQWIAIGLVVVGSALFVF